VGTAIRIVCVSIACGGIGGADGDALDVPTLGIAGELGSDALGEGDNELGRGEADCVGASAAGAVVGAGSDTPVTVPIIGLSKSSAKDLGEAIKSAITERPRMAFLAAVIRTPRMVARVLKLRLCQFFDRVIPEWKGIYSDSA